MQTAREAEVNASASLFVRVTSELRHHGQRIFKNNASRPLWRSDCYGQLYLPCSSEISNLKLIFRSGLTAFAALLLCCGSAFAGSTTQFVLRNLSTGDVYNFTLPTEPTGQWTGPDQFDLLNIAYTINGLAAPGGPAQFSFYDTAQFGGVEISYGFGETVIADPTGPQLWTGTPQDPTFIAADLRNVPDFFDPNVLYDLSLVESLVGGGGGINSVPPLVPEPWSLLLLGTGIAAFAGKARPRSGL